MCERVCVSSNVARVELYLVHNWVFTFSCVFFVCYRIDSFFLSVVDFPGDADIRVGQSLAGAGAHHDFCHECSDDDCEHTLVPGSQSPLPSAESN